MGSASGLSLRGLRMTVYDCRIDGRQTGDHVLLAKNLYYTH